MKIRTTPLHLMKASLLVMVLAMAGCVGAKEAGRAAVVDAGPGVTVAVSGAVEKRSALPARVMVPREAPAAHTVQEAHEGKELAAGEVTPEAGGVVEYGRVRLEVPEGAVKEPVSIRIVELERTEKLGLGMKNVTAGAVGYRFEPDGMRFEKPAVLKMGYEKNEVGSELERENLYTYYYNARVEKWEKLDRVAVDETAGMIVSVTEHFTDMVNSTLTLPENPKTLNFNPTSVKDVKGGDPGMGIRMIEAPEANQQGSANVKMEIEVPGGRQGMGPRLEVSYSSDGGNGWMGVGWSLGVSTLSVETRWGVPRYNGTEETETYVLDGEMLAPVAHRGGHVARTGEKEFWPRVERSFRKIVRHGTGPVNYWWEVTEKNGTKRFYGGTPEDGVNAEAVQGAAGGIAQWNLVEERDTHGNYVRYGYAVVSDSGAENGTGGVAGTTSYLDEVRWTGNRGEGLSPSFRIELVRDREQAGWSGTRRGDAVIDCRGGYKNVTADLLKRIEVYEGARVIRSYVFDYAPGAFGKNLLRAAVRYGSDGSEFYRETFEYYDEVRSGDEYAGFGGEVAATVPGDLNGTGVDLRPLLSTEPTVLGTTTGWQAGVDGYLGINWAMGFTKTNSAGVKLGYNWSGSDTQTTLMDIDGDGVTDKVFIEGGRVHYRKGVVSADGTYRVTGGQAEEIPGDQIRALGVDTSKSFSIGAEAYPLSISASLAYTTTWTDGEVYFTDANGDGLADLVNRNVVYFCHLENGRPVFGVDSGETEAPVGGGAGVASNGELEALLEAQYQGKVAASPPVDAVVEWRAPYSGTVRVSGTVKLSDGEITYTKTGSAEPVTREGYADEDGVRVSVQRNGVVIWPESGEALDIGAGDFTTNDPGNDLGTINVTKGDRLYFRVNPKFDGLFDEVEWTPGIQYVTVGGTAVDEGNQPRDGNGLLVYRYELGEDFAYAGRSGELYPGCVTTVTAGGVLRKGVTSDAVTVRVYRINAYYDNDLKQYVKIPGVRYERTFAWDEPFDAAIAATIDLDADDGVSFEVTYGSAVDVQAVSWAPEVTYDHYHDAEGTAQPLVDGNGVAYTARLPGYWKGVTYRPENGRYEWWTANKTPWVTVPLPGREPDSVVYLLARVSVPGGQPPENATSFSGRVVFTAKRAGVEEPELKGKCAFTMNGNTSLGQTVEIPLTLMGVVPNGVYSFDFHFEDENLRSLAGCSVRYRYGSEPEEIEEGVDPGGQPVLVPNWHDTSARNVFMAESENLRPAAWRGWSVFAYNAKADGGEDRGATALDEGDIVIGEDYLGPNVNPETGEGAQEPKAYVMYPAPGEGKWKSPDAECYVRRDAATGLVVLSGSRKGDDHPQRTELAQGGGGLMMMNRLTWAYQVEGGVGVSIVPEGAKVGGNIGGNLSGGESFSAVDYMDFNGDRLPDLLSETTIQYSAATGGLSAQTGSVRWKRTNRTLSGSLSGGPDFTIAEPKSKNKGQVYLNSMSGGGNVGGGLSDSTSDYQDMNGDGLPDMVSLEDGSILVRLNTGYGFAGPETWGSGDLNASVNLSGGLSVSLGFNVDNFSFGGGLSGGINYSGVKATLMDMNGDGLPDLVRKEAGSGDLLVRLNTGAGFSGVENVWHGGMPGEALSKTYGASAGVNAHATIGIPVTTIFVNFVIIISAGGNAGVNVSRQTEGLRDVNADGCPDWVASEDDGELRVRYNRSGRTNLLSGVNGPLGGRLEIEYERSLPTQENPQMKWVMSGVRVNDGHAGDGEDEQYVTYSYADGKQSRYEREGYGFGTVVSRQRQADGGTELETVTTYATDSYYRKGLVLEQVTRDGSGDLLSRLTNTYANPESVPLTDALVFFTKLLRTRTEEYEPGSSGSVTTGEEYTGYDGYGNVTGYTDLGEVSDWTDDVRVSIEYADEPAKIARHIVGLPETIEVRDATNAVVRWREGDYDDEGSLVRHRARDGARWLETEYTHDAGTGNTLSVTDPTGYRVSYEYDAGTRSVVTGVSDSLGYSSRGTYDLGLGVPLTQTDLNGNVMSYEYDAAGRLERVFGPYDGAAPALEFAYYHGERPARAVTRNKVHFDSLDTERLVTVVFADGLGRVIETKKQAAKWNSGTRRADAGMNVSGLVEYDEFGRTRFASQPEFAAGESYAFTPLTRKNATQTEYDARGRSVVVRYPDPERSTVSTAYRLANGLRETEVTDPLGRVKTSVMDSGGNIVLIRQRKGTEELVTSYVYDSMSQIVEVRDADPRGANVTRITYDRLGRRTRVETPDAGLVTYEYDASGRLWRKVDAKLRAAGQYIEYGYDPDSSRLSTVTYPATGNGGVVRYVYGTAADTNINAAGRLLSVQNPMSFTSYEYGKLGETVVVRKDLKRRWGHNETYSSEMRYRFDYLGRMEWMSYPDGEELTYGYDRGGEVTTVTGQRDGRSTAYVRQVAYDEFGQRVRLQYGNNVTTEYEYHPTRRWLSHIRTVSAGGRVFQNMTYTFDRVGNVLGTENTADGKTVRQEYRYDDLDELVRAEGFYEDRRAGGVTVRHEYEQKFDYDAIGNMVTKTSRHLVGGRKGKPDLNYSFGYAYEKARPHCAVTVGEYGYVYDANGNVTEEVYGTPAAVVKRTGNADMGGDDGDPDTGSSDFAYGEIEPTKPAPGTILRQYVWDDENRMTEAVVGNEHVYFGYDAGGERTVKYTEHGETVYVDRMYQVEPTKNPNLYTKHVFVGETRLVSRVGEEGSAYGGQNGEMYYYHPDHLGNTTWVTDNAGAEYEHVEYAPYGESWVDEGRDSLDRINHLFTSKELDKETGLYYFGARYLDPKTSRWMSTDPAMEKYLPEAPVNDEAKKRNGNLPGLGGVFNAVNLATYHYSGNNPIKYRDPNGKEIFIAFIVTEIESNEAGGLTAKGYLSVTDMTSGKKSRVENVYSGGKGYDAETNAMSHAPFGSYDVLQHTGTVPMPLFNRLEAKDDKYGDDKAIFAGQKENSLLRIHNRGTGLTYGCLSLPETGANEIAEMMKTTSTSKVEVDRKGRLGGKEPQVKYGTLVIIDATIKDQKYYETMRFY